MKLKMRLCLEKGIKTWLRKQIRGEKKLCLNWEIGISVHFHSEIFLNNRKNKLMPQGDGSFQLFERLNDYSYKTDLPMDYQVQRPSTLVILLSLMCMRVHL